MIHGVACCSNGCCTAQQQDLSSDGEDVDYSDIIPITGPFNTHDGDHLERERDRRCASAQSHPSLAEIFRGVGDRSAPLEPTDLPPPRWHLSASTSNATLTGNCSGSDA